MGKQSRAKGPSMEERRIIGYLDPQLYPELTRVLPEVKAEKINNEVKAKVKKACGNHIDTSKLELEPFEILMGGYELKVQQIEDAFIADLYITPKSEGRVSIHFGDITLLEWNEMNKIVYSDVLFVSNIPNIIDQFVSLATIREVLIIAILGLTKGVIKLSSIEDINDEVKKNKVDKKEKRTLDSKSPEYVTETWNVNGYERQDGTVVAGHVCTRNPKLLKKVGNQ